MKLGRLTASVLWETRLLARHRVVAVAAFVTALYAAIFRLAPSIRTDDLVTLLVFSDPSMLGFLFVGVLVLFERRARMLDALVVTPRTTGEYLWAKALALTLVAVPCGVAMAVAGHGPHLDYVLLVLAVALTSVLFAFLGFVAAAAARSVNEYLIVVPVFLSPAALPVVVLLGVPEPWWFRVLPARSSIVLLRAALAPASASTDAVLFAIAFLVVWIGLSFAWARARFERHVRSPRPEPRMAGS